MIRRPPRSTLDRSSAASDVYKRQDQSVQKESISFLSHNEEAITGLGMAIPAEKFNWKPAEGVRTCLLYTSPSPRDRTRSRMPSSA